MQICIVRYPEQGKIIEAEDVSAAMIEAGLQPGSVDFGSLGDDLNIVVYEFGLFESAEKRKYFSLGTALFAGPAVIFQADEAGETVDLTKPIPSVTWFADHDAVERAIVNGKVRRPHHAVNGLITWQWPQPRTKSR